MASIHLIRHQEHNQYMRLQSRRPSSGCLACSSYNRELLYLDIIILPKKSAVNESSMASALLQKSVSILRITQGLHTIWNKVVEHGEIFYEAANR